MWQVFLERFIPVMEDDTSMLDARDGVGVLAARSTSAESVSAAVGGDASPLPLA